MPRSMPFSPTSLFTTSSTSSISRHRIRIQHRQLQQPLAATGDWPAAVQPSVGKDRHEAFPRRKALCFEIKIATWKWDEFVPFSAHPWTKYRKSWLIPKKNALIDGRKGVPDWPEDHHILDWPDDKAGEWKVPHFQTNPPGKDQHQKMSHVFWLKHQRRYGINMY